MHGGNRSMAALLLALVLIAVWGSNYSLLKALLRVIGPDALIFVRYMVTPACAVAVLLCLHGLHWPRLARSDWLTVAGLAAVGHVAHVTVMTHAMHLSTPFSSALVSACGPVFTLLIVRIVSDDRIARIQVLGVATAFVGVLVFVSDKLTAAPGQGVGDLLLLVGTLLFSIHTVAAGRLMQRHGVVLVMAYATLLAAAPLLVFNARAVAAIDWSGLGGLHWAALVWSLAMASFAGWLAWGWLNAELGVSRTAPLLYLLPPVAGLISWATLGEPFGVLKITGAVIAVAGVFAAQFGPLLLRSRKAQST